jgi:hypothetical protein|tara:strand:- start:298 stop:555 length:258 start_codon:yes stop_codon:yes gene_type:complete
MKKDNKKPKKLNHKESKALYNAFLKGGGIPPTKADETPRYANDNINQGRSQKRMEQTYKVIEWVFVLAFIGMFILAMHYSFLYIK